MKTEALDVCQAGAPARPRKQVWWGVVGAAVAPAPGGGSRAAAGTRWSNALGPSPSPPIHSPSRVNSPRRRGRPFTRSAIHSESSSISRGGGTPKIEAALVEHPAVLEAAVVGRADQDDLVKPEAWPVPRGSETNEKALATALRGHCKEKLAPYKYPRWFHFVADLPKTTTGKIQRFKLRERSREAAWR